MGDVTFDLAQRRMIASQRGPVRVPAAVDETGAELPMTVLACHREIRRLRGLYGALWGMFKLKQRQLEEVEQLAAEIVRLSTEARELRG